MAAEIQQATPQEKPVLLTGFGPFHHHSVNASWAAVQEVSKLGIQLKSKAVPLEIREVPVSYQIVASAVPTLHSELSPRLCVHVGVSPYDHVKIEKCGRNTGYCQGDIFGRTPETKTCVPDGAEVLETSFDVQALSEKVSSSNPDIRVEISSDAGRYLCDFIYYTSLHVSQAPVLFVHVPELNKPYSVQQLASALKSIIETLLENLSSSAMLET